MGQTGDGRCLPRARRASIGSPTASHSHLSSMPRDTGLEGWRILPSMRRPTSAGLFRKGKYRSNVVLGGGAAEMGGPQPLAPPRRDLNAGNIYAGAHVQQNGVKRGLLTELQTMYDATGYAGGVRPLPRVGSLSLLFECYALLFTPAKQLKARLPTYSETMRANTTLCFGEVLFLLRDMGVWPFEISKSELQHLFARVENKGAPEDADQDDLGVLGFAELLTRIALHLGAPSATHRESSSQSPHAIVEAFAARFRMEDRRLYKHFIEVIGKDTQLRLNSGGGISSISRDRAKKNLLSMVAEDAKRKRHRCPEYVPPRGRGLAPTLMRRRRLDFVASRFTKDLSNIFSQYRFHTGVGAPVWRPYGHLFLDMAKVRVAHCNRYRIVVTNVSSEHIRVRASKHDLPAVTLKFSGAPVPPGLRMVISVTCEATHPHEAFGHISIQSLAGTGAVADTAMVPVYVQAVATSHLDGLDQPPVHVPAKPGLVFAGPLRLRATISSGEDDDDEAV